MTDILGWLALVFLPLAGYSAGAVLGSRGRGSGQTGGPSPSLLDTWMVLALWAGAAASRLMVLEPWPAVIVWLVVGLGLGYILQRLQGGAGEGKPLPQ